MKKNLFRLTAAALAAALLALPLNACAPAAPPVVITVVVQPTPAAQADTPAAATDLPLVVTPEAAATNTGVVPVTNGAATTAAPTAAPAPTDPPAPTDIPQPTDTSGPTCTIKQNINVRGGPGKIYDPPVDAWVAGTVVIPQAFQAQGFPGGSWVQALNPGSGRVGWVSAGTDFVDCTLNLASLPGGTVPPTPKPSAPQLTNSQPQGTFDGFTYTLHVGNPYVLRMEAFTGNGQKDGDNITQITFSVAENGEQVRGETEHAAPYCLFGGDNKCDGWPKVDGKYVWDANHPDVLVHSGTYQVNIDGEGTDENGNSIFANWHFDLIVTVP